MMVAEEKDSSLQVPDPALNLLYIFKIGANNIYLGLMFVRLFNTLT